MTAREQAKLARYDLVVVTRCGEAWQEMERADEYGDWVTYADHVAALADARRAGLSASLIKEYTWAMNYIDSAALSKSSQKRARIALAILAKAQAAQEEVHDAK